MTHNSLESSKVAPETNEIKGDRYTVSAKIPAWKVDKLDLIAFRRGRDTRRAHVIEEAIDQYLGLKPAA